MQADLIEDVKVSMESTLAQLQGVSTVNVLKVQQAIIRATHQFMFERGLVQLMPLMLSPITDPLNHGVVDAAISYAGSRWSLTKSMIFHKQLALLNPELEALYIVSPNVRLEFADRAFTGRHLFEFTQIDFEFRNKDGAFVRSFMEELTNFIFAAVKRDLPEIVAQYRPESLPEIGKLEVYRTEELEAQYGPDYEHIKSKEATQPFWLLNHRREFYDKEDPAKPGTYLNYDLIWPEGFGEGLSGGERENEYNQILKRMGETGSDQEAFKHYLQVAQQQGLPYTAGAGFGVERMARFICRIKDINDVTPFSRRPGMPALF
ncbi:asparagine synthetase A [Rufibacter tibetensis]|uniref:Asparaginyl-tRNA synthetase n=1 Tax=Rufibacter tibetensis TaxID=512763 RepID=A0A0P0CPK0_9BACT|nr:asparagine synthetase A [Rufibacter tibetensis]ALI99215.1 asparaginyl-tRNA synthetase [Rufibacter tibetensis]